MKTYTTIGVLCPNKKPHRSSPGFSLVEILVVLAVIGMLAGLAIYNIGPIAENAKIRTAKSYVSSTIKTPIHTYSLDVGKPPSKLKDLVVNPGVGPRWKGPYVDIENFEDPWGNDYQYRIPPENSIGSFDVWSNGPDGNSGTSDDIGNWSS